MATQQEPTVAQRLDAVDVANCGDDVAADALVDGQRRVHAFVTLQRVAQVEADVRQCGREYTWTRYDHALRSNAMMSSARDLIACSLLIIRVTSGLPPRIFDKS